MLVHIQSLATQTFAVLIYYGCLQTLGKIFSLITQPCYRVITGHGVVIEGAFPKQGKLSFYFTVSRDHLEARWPGCR